MEASSLRRFGRAGGFAREPSFGSPTASSGDGRTFQNCFLDQSGHRRERCRLGTVHGVAYYHSSCWYGSCAGPRWSTSPSAAYRQAMNARNSNLPWYVCLSWTAFGTNSNLPSQDIRKSMIG
ncbi:hypothetical protein [Azospirillum melinis]